MKEIIVNSWSRSGTTWLIHLLSDLLNSPQQDMPGGEVVGYWGLRDDGDYVIRKRHDPHGEEYKSKTVALIHRNPCDVVVSTAFYLGISFDGAIDMMAGYNKWLEPWLNNATVVTRYEDLRDCRELQRVVEALAGKVLPYGAIVAAMKRQSFDNMTKQLNDTHFMRRGVAGDWLNHLNSKQVSRLYRIM